MDAESQLSAVNLAMQALARYMKNAGGTDNELELRHRKWLHTILTKAEDAIEAGQPVAFSIKELDADVIPTKDQWNAFNKWYFEKICRLLDATCRKVGEKTLRLSRVGGGGRGMAARVSVYLEELSGDRPTQTDDLEEVPDERLVKSDNPDVWRSFGQSLLVVSVFVLALMHFLPSNASPAFGIFIAVVLLFVGVWSIDKANKLTKRQAQAENHTQ